jgi:hypothetical protein
MSNGYLLTILLKDDGPAGKPMKAANALTFVKTKPDELGADRSIVRKRMDLDGVTGPGLGE